MKEEIEKYLKIGYRTILKISNDNWKTTAKTLGTTRPEPEDDDTTVSCSVDLSDDEKIGVVLLQTANALSAYRSMSKTLNNEITGCGDLMSSMLGENLMFEHNLVNGISCHVEEDVEKLEDFFLIIKKIMVIDGVGTSTLPSFLYKGKPFVISPRIIKNENIKDFVYEVDLKLTVDNYVFIYCFGISIMNPESEFLVRYAIVKKD